MGKMTFLDILHVTYFKGVPNISLCTISDL